MNDISELFIHSPWLLYVLTTLISLAVGSFLNVFIYRYPLMLKRQWLSECQVFLRQEAPHTLIEDAALQTNHQAEDPARNASTKKTADFNLFWPASHCPHCQHKLGIRDNIPLISYLWLKGRCHYCQAKISPRYPLVELLTLLLSLMIVATFGFGLPTLAYLGLVWTLIGLSFIDIDNHLLPDDVTLLLLWAGIGFSLAGILPVTLEQSVIGSMAGYLSLWFVYHGFKLLTGKEGMGFGDFKLLAALGAWLGWQALPEVIFLSALIGAIFGVLMILVVGKDKNIPIPYGPYLSFAALVALIYPQPFVHFITP